KGRAKNMNKYKKIIASSTNFKKEKGTFVEIIKNTDVFVGVSGVKNMLTSSMIKTMNQDPIVFALTNPEPEIDPLIAKKAGVKIIATGSYRFHNRVNNALRSEEHTSELQSLAYLVCRLLLEKKKKKKINTNIQI